jgi:hypothetical protein
VNFGTPVPLLLGIFLVLSAVALFFLDKLKPGYGRDSDKVYAILFLLSGIFLLGSLTMELIPSFQQMIMVGMLIALMIQNVNSRTPTGGRGQSNADADPYRGGRDYRPSSRPSRPSYGYGDTRTNMRAELDMRGSAPIDPYARPRPMLGGREEPSQRPPYPQNEYGDRYSRDMPPSESGSRGDSQPPYSGSSVSRPADDRVRRRRPSKVRGDMNDPYRVDPGPPRPNYPPDRNY